MLLSLVGMVTYSQESASYDIKLGYDQTYQNFIGNSRDTIGTGDSIWYYTINKLTDSKLNQYVYLSLDRISGTGIVDVYFQSKTFLEDTFVNYDTVTYYTTADTVIRVNTSSTKSADYWRVYIKGRTDGKKVKVLNLNTKYFK